MFSWRMAGPPVNMAGPPVNMFSSNLPNPFIAWEGEAPAEPLRRKLGRSLALPLISDGST